MVSGKFIHKYTTVVVRIIQPLILADFYRIYAIFCEDTHKLMLPRAFANQNDNPKSPQTEHSPLPVLDLCKALLGLVVLGDMLVDMP